MFEYKVIPAPMQVKRSKGAKNAAERLAIEVQDSINETAADGWQYVRSDTMTVMDKPGRFSRPVEVIETVLIFRREKSESKPLFLKTPAKEAAEPVPATPPAEEMTAPQVTNEDPKPMAREPRESIAPKLGGVTRD